MSFYIVSTPIGNLEDLSERSIRILKESEIILCEKKVRALKLISYLRIKNVKLVPYHDSKSEKIFNLIHKELNNSKNISLISDAGTPLISDPGNKLVKKLIENNFDPIVIPGPSSIISSLVISGLDIGKFIFYGFLPKSKNKIEKELLKYLDLQIPVLFFVSKNDMKKVYDILKDYPKNIFYSLSKEITKKNEKTLRGEINDLSEKKLFNFIEKGELILILNLKYFQEVDEKIIREEIKLHKMEKISKKDVAYKIREKFQIKKNLSYELTIKYWDEN